MALKGDRLYVQDDVSFYMNTTAERGIIVTYNTAGSGVAMDQADATVTIPSGGISGTVPAGLLLNDVVNLDLTRQIINHHKFEVQQGGKVQLLKKGWVVTNMIATGVSPTAGSPAFYDTDGKLVIVNPLASSNPANAGVDSQAHRVGTFMSSKDDNGYAKLSVDIK